MSGIWNRRSLGTCKSQEISENGLESLSQHKLTLNNLAIAMFSSLHKMGPEIQLIHSPLHHYLWTLGVGAKL